MPKQLTRYICEVCGYSYAFERQAEICESKHIKPKKIIKANYDISDKKNEYPTTIIIELQNGEKIEYKRQER